MYFLYNCLSFFRNIYYTIFKKKVIDTDIKSFLEKLNNEWYSTCPNTPIYYDILSLYIKHNNKHSFNDVKINEYKTILNNLKNTNTESYEKDYNLDLDEHMKYYITGWYILNMCKTEVSE